MVLTLLEELEKALKEKDTTKLKFISNKAIEKAAFTEQEWLVDLSLISYALYKLMSKSHIRKSPEWKKFLRGVKKDLREAIDSENNDVKSILEKDILVDISVIDDSFGNYIRDTIEKARVKQASRIYALGISLDKAVSLTKADRFQLLEYIGDTRIHDRPFTTVKRVEDRYNFFRELVG